MLCSWRGSHLQLSVNGATGEKGKEEEEEEEEEEEGGER